MHNDALWNIRNSCKICKGTGSVVEVVDSIRRSRDCVCLKQIANVSSAIKANIPEQYLSYFPIDRYDSDFLEKNKTSIDTIKNYMKNIHDNIQDGHGLWMASSPGLGKSITVCNILKRAISLGHKAYYERASHIISLKFDALNNDNASDLLDYIVKDVEILAIEEIEKVYLMQDNAFPNHLFYEFLSDIYDSKKSIILTSNEIPSVIMKKLPTFLADRLNTLPQIMFTGYSKRKKVS